MTRTFHINRDYVENQHNYAERPALAPVAVLAAFAEPSGQSATDWQREARTLRACLAPVQSRFRLDVLFGATADDLHQAVLRGQPSVVHLHGHGNAAGLALEDTAQGVHLVAWDALRRVLAPASCVVLHACDGAWLAPAQPAVIATAGPLSSDTARVFTAGFYDALAAGLAYPACYAAGCDRIRLQGLTDALPTWFGGRQCLTER